jgi:hypothetical protein
VQCIPSVASKVATAAASSAAVVAPEVYAVSALNAGVRVAVNASQKAPVA